MFSYRFISAADKGVKRSENLGVIPGCAGEEVQGRERRMDRAADRRLAGVAAVGQMVWRRLAPGVWVVVAESAVGRLKMGWPGMLAAPQGVAMREQAE